MWLSPSGQQLMDYWWIGAPLTTENSVSEGLIPQLHSSPGSYH